MLVNAYLIIKKNYGHYNSKNAYSFRVAKTKPAISSDEISLLLAITIPDKFFERIVPVIELKLPENAVLTPTIESAVKISAFSLAERLGLNVDDVEDGLVTLLKKKKEEKE